MKQELRDERRNRGRRHDEIWCVFDRDEHERFDAAIALAAEKGINVAVSNPCLELWFVIHFQDQTSYLDRHDAQQIAKGLLGCDTVLTSSALDALVERHAAAADRAQRLDRKHQGDGTGPYANPSSGIWRLIEVIQSAR